MTIDKSPQAIQTMFNIISDKYDFINNIISFGTQKIIKKKCIKPLRINPHDKVLDLCCGTGDLAEIIKKNYPDAIVTGIDFSEKMLNIAKDKINNVLFLQGDATNLPFPDESFDIVTMSFGLRNIQNAEKAIEEIYRILKPKGKFLHIDFGEKNIFSKLFDKFTYIFAGILSDSSYAYKYLIKSKQEFLTPDDLIKDFEKKGFSLFSKNDYALGVISCQIMQKPTNPLL